MQTRMIPRGRFEHDRLDVETGFWEGIA